MIIFLYIAYTQTERAFYTILIFLNKKKNSNLSSFKMPWARLELALDLTPTGF